MSVRIVNWQSALHGFLTDAKLRPFAWGGHDCCLFACDAVAAFSDCDPGAPFRDRYGTGVGALRTLREYLNTDAGTPTPADELLERAIAKRAADIGAVEIRPSRVSRGDVVLADVTSESAFGVAVGVCVGERIAVAGLVGVTLMPRTSLRRAWRI